MNPPFPYFGETLALSCALVWAFAVILFRRSGETVHPLALNLFKNLLAVVLFLPTMALMREALLRPAPARDYVLLLLSGALGIGVADTLFFMSLNTLGAGLSAIVDCLYSPAIILLSVLWLDERLSLWQVFGVVLIVSAVFTATAPRRETALTRRRLALGVLWGALAMVTMAVGIVMIKPLLERSPLLWVTEVRLWGGIAILLVVLLFRSDRRAVADTVLRLRQWGPVLGGSFAGAYVALLLWLGGMKYAQVSIASALNQTSNLFVFVLAALLLREPLTLRRVLGIGLGVAGAYLVTFG